MVVLPTTEIIEPIFLSNFWDAVQLGWYFLFIDKLPTDLSTTVDKSVDSVYH